jgi:pyrimidine operon attenuation protein/uracil phosphoribosyltransferase
MNHAKVVLDEDDVRRTLVRIAHEIVEKNAGQAVALVGIHRRGAHLATRLHRLVCDLLDEDVPLGDIDIAFYRDDVATRPVDPAVHDSHLPFRLEDYTVVLIDDVLYTGRTARAGIEALFDYGRPARVQLAVLADRGHRELPIRPDYVGKNLPTARDERVNVRVTELDGIDEVAIVTLQEALACGTCSRSRTSIAPGSSGSSTAPSRSPRSPSARSSRSPRCAAGACSISSTRPRPAPARASSSPPRRSAPR